MASSSSSTVSVPTEGAIPSHPATPLRTFASATVLYRHFGWKAGVPGYALATYVAGSRLSENAHFQSDVLFGAGIGIVSGRTVTVGRAHPFVIAPAAGPGMVGVSVTMVPRQ